MIVADAASIHSSKADVVKETYAGLLRWLAETARRDTLGENTSDLEELPPARRELLRAAYARQRERLHLHLGLIGQHLPHITDTRWKMDHIVKV